MKNPSIQKSLLKGFTLVELLVVIAIIAVLAGLAFPAVNSVIRSAKRTESEKVASDITFAIDAFRDDYDYLPYAGGSTPDTDTKIITNNGDFLEVLMGEDDTINPNNKKYFSAQNSKNGINGIIYSGTGDEVEAMKDSFGNHYEILVDYDLDDKLNPSTINAQFSEEEIVRSKSVIIGTPGANEAWDNADWKDSWAVKSW